MTLRTRLFVSSGLVAVPLVVGSFLLDERLRLGAMEETLRATVDAELASALRARCEDGLPLRPRWRRPLGARGPDRAPGAPGGLVLFTYATDGTAALANAPPLPAETVSTFRAGLGRGVQMRFATGGGGHCAVGLARLPPRPGQQRDQLVAVALVVASVLGGVWLAAGPVISRLRRLAADVRVSAASTYEQPVAVDADDEVATLAQAFNDAGASVRAHLLEVRAREDTLRQFVADTSHDMAIPMSVLQGHLASLDEALGGTPPVDLAAREHLRHAIGETHYMASLLRNLAVATKLGDTSAPLALGPVNLGELVERVVARHRPIARSSGVDLNHAVPGSAVVVRADATLLEQAVSNLVDNAIRYNVQRGHVAVVLEAVGAATFELSVTDDGAGVSNEDLAHLTTRWFRGSRARTRRPDGAGLGLAITAEACQRLGLTLTFTRPPGGGLTATIATPGSGVESAGRASEQLKIDTVS